MSLYMHAQAVLDDARAKDVAVIEALRIASTYEPIMSGRGRFRSSRSQRVEKMFRIFGVEDPEQP